MSDLLGPGPHDDLFIADAELAARKLARQPQSAQAAATSFELLQWFTACGAPLPEQLLEAIRKQMGVPRIQGLPPRIQRDATFIEAAGRDALALAAQVVRDANTIPDCRRVIQEHVANESWRLPLRRLARALDPDPDHDGRRGTIRSWRTTSAYHELVAKVAIEMARLFLGETLSEDIAITVSGHELQRFVPMALSGNLDGETLTGAVVSGVGEAPSPTSRTRVESDKVREEPGADARCA